MCLCVPDRIGIWKVFFKERGKPEYPEKNTFAAKERTNNKLKPHMVSTPGFIPRPHWWEASALTAAPPLLPQITCT